MKIPTYLPDKEATIPRVTSTHRIDGDTYRPVFATGRATDGPWVKKMKMKKVYPHLFTIEQVSTMY